jgi:L-fuconolactonase
MIVDAHLHYWQPARGDYGWLEHAPTALRKAFLAEDILAQRKAAGVTRSVLVQAAPSEAETRFLFELARADEGIAGVVGWVDFNAPDVDARIRALVKDGDGVLVGLRPMAQDIADPDWLDAAALDAAFASVREHQLAFDALVTAAQWPALARRLAREPSLRVVLDHAGKPDIAAGAFDTWAAHLATLAAYPQLHCKLSGLLPQLGAAQPEDTLDAYVEHVFASFGPERLLWGSDWPVVTLRTDYRAWLALAQRYIRRLAPTYEAHILGLNAAAFYRLPSSNGSSL